MNKAPSSTLADQERDADTVTAHLPQDRFGVPGSDLLWETPREVALPLIWLAISGGTGALQCLLLVAFPPDPWTAPTGPAWVGELRLTGYAWLVLATSALLAAHSRLGPAVWGATFGFLFVQCAALTTTFVRSAIALGHDPQLVSHATDIVCLVQGAFHLALPTGALAITILYFRAGGWYGVPDRRHWRTVLLSGGWMLLLTFLIFGASQAAEYCYLR